MIETRIERRTLMTVVGDEDEFDHDKVFITAITVYIVAYIMSIFYSI